MNLLKEIIVEYSIVVLDDSNLNNIHSKVIYKEKIIKTIEDYILHLTKQCVKDNEQYISIDKNDLINNVSMLFEYENNIKLDEVFISNEIESELIEYIIDYIN